MKQSPSPLWTVTFYLTLSAICVAVHGWNRRNAEAAIAGEDDDMMVAKNELLTMNQNDLNSNDNSKMDEGNEKCFLIGLDAYRQCRDGTSPPTEKKGDLPSSPGLSQNNRIGEIKGVTGNYKLSFEITPRGTVSGWGSILAFNNGNACCGFGSVSPAIWFYPGATTLYYTIGDSTDGLWRFDTSALPLNVRTAVTLVCNGKNVTLTVGAKVYTATQPTYRYVGSLTVYAGDPWYSAANAEIRSLKYEILPATKSYGASLQKSNHRARDMMTKMN